jgi:hypothetical protein
LLFCFTTSLNLKKQRPRRVHNRMKEVQEFIQKNKRAIIIIIVIVILFLLYRKYGYVLGRLFKPATQNMSPEALTDVRKAQIESTIKDIKTDIYETAWSGHDYAPYERLLGYYDNEIIYGADYYKNFLANGNTLHSDLSDQWFVWGDVNKRVLDKLNELGKS